MSTDTMEEVDLEAMVSSGDDELCQVRGVSVRLFGMPLHIQDECREVAVATMILKCPKDGTNRERCCAKHRDEIRKSKDPRSYCPVCFDNYPVEVI